MNNNNNKKNPILSVIVPVYNVERYIQECMNSLINQTIEDIEIIVVNDGSKDRSIEIVREINDSRIRILNKINGGLSSARNFGLENANGKYITFVDSDDFIILKTAYKEMVELCERYNLDIVVGNVNRYYDENKIIPMNTANKIFNRNIVSSEEYFQYSVNKKRIFAPVWQSIYKKDLIIKNGLFFKEGILHEDELFSPQVIIKSNRIGLYNKNFYNYRQRQGSIMNSEDNRKKRVSDMNKVCCELNDICDNLQNDICKKSLQNYISFLLLSVAYNNRSKIDKSYKRMIKKNSNRVDLKIKYLLLSINENIYYTFEYISLNIKRILKKIILI